MAKKLKKGQVYMSGLNTVLNTLNSEIKKIEGYTAAGLINASIRVRKSMETNEPKIPIDTNNLRASYFATPFKHKNNPAITMGFTAEYAPRVHEMVNVDFGAPRPGAVSKARQGGGRPGAGAKFFESALLREMPGMLQDIKDSAQIK